MSEEDESKHDAREGKYSEEHFEDVPPHHQDHKDDVGYVLDDITECGGNYIEDTIPAVEELRLATQISHVLMHDLEASSHSLELRRPLVNSQRKANEIVSEISAARSKAPSRAAMMKAKPISTIALDSRLSSLSNFRLTGDVSVSGSRTVTDDSKQSSIIIATNLTNARLSMETGEATLFVTDHLMQVLALDVMNLPLPDSNVYVWSDDGHNYVYACHHQKPALKSVAGLQRVQEERLIRSNQVGSAQYQSLLKGSCFVKLRYDTVELTTLETMSAEPIADHNALEAELRKSLDYNTAAKIHNWNQLDRNMVEECFERFADPVTGEPRDLRLTTRGSVAYLVEHLMNPDNNLAILSSTSTPSDRSKVLERIDLCERWAAREKHAMILAHVEILREKVNELQI